MIVPLTYGHVFSVYFCLWFAIIALLWLFEELRNRRSSEWSVVKERLYFCRNCHLSFLATHNSENLTRCPRCNEMCFIRKKKRF